jgi:hypothetical protein
MRNRSRILVDLLSSLLLGWGVLLLLAPVPLYWFIHGDSQRYLWIINGPFPFSSFGGGPFQLFTYVGLAVLGGAVITAAVLMRRKIGPPVGDPASSRQT